MARTLRALRSRADDGLAMVEFAIVGSLLMVLLFGILSAGVLISAHTQAADEARFAARVDAVKPDCLTTWPSGVVTKTVTKPVNWFVPLIPGPSAATETVDYKCGG
jgi:TadE-like protein